MGEKQFAWEDMGLSRDMCRHKRIHIYIYIHICAGMQTCIGVYRVNTYIHIVTQRYAGFSVWGLQFKFLSKKVG